MKRISFMSIAMVTLLASCSSDMELSQTGEKFDGKVTLSAPAYEYEDGTRTTLTSSESGISFAWDDDETIGIFPIAPTTNAQAHQKLDNGSNNGTKSSFDGAGWALLRGNTYAAYYPFQTKEYEDYTKIPIDMTGQTQNGNGTLAHIGAGYDYMYATASVPKNGDVSFDFNHVCSIVKLELTMPVAATWENVTLSSGSSVFITKATMNASTGAIASVTKSSSVVLSLSNVSTTSANQKLELYMAVLPTTTGDLTVKARTSANYDYTATLSSKTLKAGKAHLLTATLVAATFTGDGVENGHAYVDLGLSVKWATMNVGASSPADYGNYYAWGETKAYNEADETNLTNYNYNSKSSYVKTYYAYSTYKWCNGSSDSMTKYGTVDNKTTLDSEDDAASVNWGGKWRMPTHTEQLELVDNCYWVWTSSYNSTGKAGYIIYKAKSSSDKGQVVTSGNTPSSSYSLSDSHIFLPAAGCRNGGLLWYAGSSGYYWSASVCDGYVRRFYFNSSRFDRDSYGCWDGPSVRAVCE
ncbi:MAG: fimbrillin family protein [Bacteroidaceae bacterium]|nr:fimbrillin family protein [Bacteroidaceae bacterium]